MAHVELPLPFEQVPAWVHEAWVGLQSCERMLQTLDHGRLTDAQLRLVRTTLIHCLELGMIALNGVHEDLTCRGDFGEGGAKP